MKTRLLFILVTLVMRSIFADARSDIPPTLSIDAASALAAKALAALNLSKDLYIHQIDYSGIMDSGESPAYTAYFNRKQVSISGPDSTPTQTVTFQFIEIRMDKSCWLVKETRKMNNGDILDRQETEIDDG